MWDTFVRDYGPSGDPLVLVAKGTTREFNSTYPQKRIDRDLAKDEAFYRAEYYCEWRTDVNAFIDRSVVEALVPRGLMMRPPLRSVPGYVARVDPASGIQQGRRLRINGPRYFLDCLLERKPPFSAEEVVAEFAQTIKNYRCYKVVGDAYAPGHTMDAFRRRGLKFEQSKLAKSAIYLAALPLLTSGMASLLDDRTLITQLIGLERRVAWGGRESVDHRKDAHDDVVNSALGALVQAAAKQDMHIADAVVGWPSRLVGDTWYARETPGERGVDRLARMQKAARTMKAVNLDDGGKETLKGPILSARGG